MHTNLWRCLQLFAEGGEGSPASGEEAGSAATVAASTGADGQDHLRALGVPDSVIAKHNARRSKGGAKAGAAPQAAQQKDQQGSVPPAAEGHPVEDQQEQQAQQAQEAPKLADILKQYPSINDEVQSTIKARLSREKGAAKSLQQVGPLLSMIASGYGIEIDSENPDYSQLADAYMHDPDRYQDIALEKGITSQQAMDEALQERQQQEWNAHFDTLQQQAMDFQKVVPGFDLRAEMQNPVFARITAPGGLSVEDAYHAIHWKELQTATAQATARKTREQMSAAIQSGTRRPMESGTSSQAPSTTTFNYARATADQRAAFKAQLRAAWARGETVYPTR